MRLRNRLAGTILAALHDGEARRELATLADGETARGWLAGEDSRWAGPLAARAGAACAALGSRPLLAPAPGLRQGLDAAALLFDAGLFFEAHEVLEPYWTAASGEAREALQGLIQVAVGWQHLANGNREGARSLLLEGGIRLHRARLLDVELEPFARTAVSAGEQVAAGLPPTPSPFPH
jgi:hypothetical protein